MMKSTCTTLLAFCLILTLTARAADSVRIHGSDLLRDVLREPIERFAADSDRDVTLRFGGSIPAMSEMRRDQSDIALIALPDGRAMDEERFTYLPIGFKVAVIGVNGENPVSEISIPNLGGIFGRATSGVISRWGDLGLSGSWGPRSIQAYAYEAPDNISQSIFQHEVLDGGVLRATIGKIVDRDRLRSILVNDASALVLAGNPNAPRGTRLLPVARGRSGDDAFAFGPTAENVYHGDYPLRLPFYVVYKSERRAELAPFLRFLFSNDVAEALTRNDILAVPENFRRRFILELDNE